MLHRVRMRYLVRGAALCLMVGSVLLLSAFSPSSAGGASAASANNEACSLLTTDEVAATIGKRVQAVKLPTGGGSTTACDYPDAANKGNWFVSTTVTASTPAQAKGIHEATKGGGRDQKAVPGLGDDAYWDNTFGQLDVLKGRYAVSMTVTADATKDRLNAARTLAQKMLARLP